MSIPITIEGTQLTIGEQSFSTRHSQEIRNHCIHIVELREKQRVAVQAQEGGLTWAAEVNWTVGEAPHTILERPELLIDSEWSTLEPLRQLAKAELEQLQRGKALKASFDRAEETVSAMTPMRWPGTIRIARMPYSPWA